MGVSQCSHRSSPVPPPTFRILPAHVGMICSPPMHRGAALCSCQPIPSVAQVLVSSHWRQDYRYSSYTTVMNLAHVLCVCVCTCIRVLVCVFERATGLSHGIWLLTLQVKRKCCLIILLRQYCRLCRADPNAALQVARSGGVEAAVAVLTATGGAESLGLLWTLRSPLSRSLARSPVLALYRFPFLDFDG